MKRLIVLSAAFLLAVAFVVPRVGFAQTADIQSQINALLAEVQQLQAQLAAQGGSTTVPAFCYTFTSNLSIGQSGAAVTALQTALQKDGESVSVTGTFDDQTASAVTGFQEKYASAILAPYGLTNGTGYVGSATRAELNSLFGCGTTTIPTSSTGSGQNGSPTIVPVTVTSPSAGQSFAQGSTMSIQWTPASGGVAQIQLVSTSGGESPFIYGEKVFGDPVDYSGYYSFLVSAGIPIGSYYVRLINPENDNAATPSVIGQSGVFAVTVAVPVVTSVVSPGMISPGYGAFVAGTNLPMQNATIVIDTGTAIAQTVTPTSYNSGFSLGFLLPAGILAGSHSIEVQSNGVTSNSVIFTVVAPPSVSQVNPTTVTPGATVTVSGQNFDGNSYVSLGNVPTGPENLPVAATSYTATSLTFVVPSNLASGVFPLYVAEHNSSLVSNQVSITISPSSNTSNLPTISSISPNQGTANTSVTVYGTNFTADGHQAVQFYASNGTLAGTVNFIDMSYISSQSMTFSPYGLNMAPGTYQVEVVTAAGTSNGQSFTLTAPTPAQVTVTSPVAGQTFTPGSVMTVQWTPISPAITEIDLVPTDGSYPTHGHWLYQGNCGTSCYPGTSLSYGFGSPLPSNIPPGSYYIAFYSSGTLIGQSGTFMVTAPQLSVPTVSIAPTSMAFSLLSGSNSPSPASSYTTFTVSPNQSVNWTALPSANWIIVSPSGSAQTNGTASISINAQAAASLSPGTHTATVTFSPASGSTSFTPQMVSVILTVTSAPVAANPYDVNGDGVVNLLDYQTEQAAVLGSNTTCGLKCDLNGDGQVNVVDLQKMTNYLLSIGISPTESASPSSLAFTVSAGSISSPSPSSASFAINNYLPNAGITVANAYTSPLPSGANWLSVGAMNGSGVTSVSVQPGNAPGGLAAGTYTASITVSAYGQTVTVPVTLTVTPVIAPAANIYDVNGDGVVNMLDYQVELAAALGTNTTCGLKCDLNGDGQVNVVDLQKMTNYLLSIGINPNATTSTTQPAATLSINGSTGGQSFAAGQPWTLSLSSTGVPSTPFSLCYQNTPPGGSAGSVSCTSAGFGTTDGNGNWSLSGAFATSTVGSDAEWVTFPSANLSSNHITFTVTNPGVSAATDNQSQLATVFLSLAGLIHSLSNVLK